MTEAGGAGETIDPTPREWEMSGRLQEWADISGWESRPDIELAAIYRRDELTHCGLGGQGRHQ